MPQHLCLSITFLDPRFHGRCDGGEPEWPPSPLRLYQAIVAASAAATGTLDHIAPALRWFEQLCEACPPTIVAPVGRTGEPYRLSVPNNSMDLVAKAWAKGNYDGSGDSSPATHRTMKTVRPTHLRGGDQVHYLWALPDPPSADDMRHAETIRTAVRAVVALGWGVDLVVGHGRVLGPLDADRLGSTESNERWLPGPSARWAGVRALRVPRAGTLDALGRRHLAFVGRMAEGAFTPVPPLTAFAPVHYRRATDPLARPFAVFALRDPDNPEKARAFRAELSAKVAAMLRHVACAAAQEDTSHDFPGGSNHYVAGHTRDNPALKRAATPPRFSYLPLPSVTGPHPDFMIRRVLIAEPFGGDGSHAAWAASRLHGQLLIAEDTKQPAAILGLIDGADKVLPSFVGPPGGAREWTSVTPVVLPGYDGLNVRKSAALFSRACAQAGLRRGCIEDFEFVGAPRAAAGQFFVPSYLRDWPLRHIRVRFREPFIGPFSIGAGRHCGLGVFAVESGV